MQEKVVKPFREYRHREQLDLPAPEPDRDGALDGVDHGEGEKPQRSGVVARAIAGGVPDAVSPAPRQHRDGRVCTRGRAVLSQPDHGYVTGAGELSGGWHGERGGY